RLLELGNELLRKDGSLPRFGNSSPDHVIRDLWGLMTAAHSHGLLLSLPRNRMITPLTIYYCADFPSPPSTLTDSPNSSLNNGTSRTLARGNCTTHLKPLPDAVRVLEETPSTETTLRLFPEGGWAFLRSPGLDAELVINGDPGSKTRGHGDCGRGSFELWWRGTVLIREPGNPTYTLPARHW